MAVKQHVSIHVASCLSDWPSHFSPGGPPLLFYSHTHHTHLDHHHSSAMRHGNAILPLPVNNSVALLLLTASPHSRPLHGKTDPARSSSFHEGQRGGDMGDVMCCMVCGRKWRSVNVGDVMSCVVCGRQGSSGPSGAREGDGRTGAQPNPRHSFCCCIL